MQYRVVATLFVASGLIFVAAESRAQNHGAIAYDSKSHHWGWAVHRPSAAAAEKAALAYCNRNAGGGCEIKLQFANECGAYARGTNHVGGWGKAKSKDEAIGLAKGWCSGHGGEGCTLQVWACAEAPMEELFGALSYDYSTHRYGWAVNYPNQASADAAADHACGTGCKIREKFFGECAAYATNAAHHFGWAKKATREEAERGALAECAKGGNGCSVKVWGCSSRE